LTTSYIQTTATLGVFLVVQVIGLDRYDMDAKAFARWGRRHRRAPRHVGLEA